MVHLFGFNFSYLPIFVCPYDLFKDQASLSLDHFKDKDIEADFCIDRVDQQLYFLRIVFETDEREFDHAEKHNSPQLGKQTNVILVWMLLDI